MIDLSNISIGIKTFLRDEMLYNTVTAIGKTMPEAQIIVADDGRENEYKTGVYNSLRENGHSVLQMPFDSGFGAKSNAIAKAFILSRRKYLLIGSDDFDFSPVSVRQGIERLVVVMESQPEVDIASGRVNGRPYEFYLLDEGSSVYEFPINTNGWFKSNYPVPCDLTVNYSLMRTRVFNKVHWDDDVKIGGGEHGAFFLDCKRAELSTVYVPGVEISEQKDVPADWDYLEYRRRALSADRPCFDKRGVKRYYLGSGQLDYDATINRSQIVS